MRPSVAHVSRTSSRLEGPSLEYSGGELPRPGEPGGAGPGETQAEEFPTGGPQVGGWASRFEKNRTGETRFVWWENLSERPQPGELQLWWLQPEVPRTGRPGSDRWVTETPSGELLGLEEVQFEPGQPRLVQSDLASMGVANRSPAANEEVRRRRH